MTLLLLLRRTATHTHTQTHAHEHTLRQTHRLQDQFQHKLIKFSLLHDSIGAHSLRLSPFLSHTHTHRCRMCEYATISGFSTLIPKACHEYNRCITHYDTENTFARTCLSSLVLKLTHTHIRGWLRTHTHTHTHNHIFTPGFTPSDGKSPRAPC